MRSTSEPLIDGYFDDWLLDRASLRSLRGTDGTNLFATGLFGRWLYLYAEIRDKNVVFRSPEPGDDRSNLRGPCTARQREPAHGERDADIFGRGTGDDRRGP